MIRCGPKSEPNYTELTAMQKKPDDTQSVTQTELETETAKPEIPATDPNRIATTLFKQMGNSQRAPWGFSESPTLHAG